MTIAPYGYHPGTKIPRKAPASDHHDVKGCKYCGDTDVVWERHGDRWRLVDIGGNKHVCKKLTTDE